MAWSSTKADSCQLRALSHETASTVPDIADLINVPSFDQLGALDDLHRPGGR